MFQHLPKTLAAAVLSLAVAAGGLTATATPARADTEDVLGVLAGLAALYAIGRVIHENRDRPQDVRSPGRPNPNAGHGPRRVAPARCFRDGHDVHGNYYRGYGARCMQNNVRRPGALPPQCIRQVQTHRGWRNIYGGRCLAQNGWQREAGFRP